MARVKPVVTCCAPDGGAPVAMKPCRVTVQAGSWAAELECERHLPHGIGELGAWVLVGADFRLHRFEAGSGRRLEPVEVPPAWLFKAAPDALVVQTESGELRVFDRELRPMWSRAANGWLLGGLSNGTVMLSRGLEVSTLDLKTGALIAGVFET